MIDNINNINIRQLYDIVNYNDHHHYPHHHHHERCKKCWGHRTRGICCGHLLHPFCWQKIAKILSNCSSLNHWPQLLYHIGELKKHCHPWFKLVVPSIPQTLTLNHQKNHWVQKIFTKLSAQLPCMRFLRCKCGLWQESLMSKALQFYFVKSS